MPLETERGRRASLKSDDMGSQGQLARNEGLDKSCLQKTRRGCIAASGRWTQTVAAALNCLTERSLANWLSAGDDASRIIARRLSSLLRVAWFVVATSATTSEHIASNSSADFSNTGISSALPRAWSSSCATVVATAFGASLFYKYVGEKKNKNIFHNKKEKVAPLSKWHLPAMTAGRLQDPSVPGGGLGPSCETKGAARGLCMLPKTPWSSRGRQTVPILMPRLSKPRRVAPKRLTLTCQRSERALRLPSGAMRDTTDAQSRTSRS